MANVGCAFFSGMPASGSLTRSVLSWGSGGRTPLASLITGIICALGVVLVGHYIQYIPKATLAVMVISIGISLLNRHAIHICMRSTRSDASVFVLTLLAGLFFPLDTAIYFGVGLSIVLFLRKAATPELVEYGFSEEGELTEIEAGERRQKEISIVHVEGNLFFGAAELFRDQMRRICADDNLKIVVVKMRNAHHLDATAVMALEELLSYMRELDRILLLSECRIEHIRIFKSSGLLEQLGRENVFPDNAQNPTLATARALKRAMQIMGGDEAKIRIYVNPSKQAKSDKE
mgnify:CR=1 FL=1